MRYVRPLLVAVLCIPLMGAWCPRPPGTPPNEKHLGAATRLELNGDYCGAAAAQMWIVSYAFEPSQTEIMNFMLGRPPAGYTGHGPFGSGGVKSGQVADAVALWTGQNVWFDEYSSGDPRGGQDQAIADQKKNVDQNRLVIVPIYNHFHYTLMDGYQWRSLANGQAESTGVYVHDPAVGHTFQVMGQWKFMFGAPWVNIQQVGTKLITTSEDWFDFDEWGGTYYGDPNPPPCSRCDRPPIEAFLRLVKPSTVLSALFRAHQRQ